MVLIGQMVFEEKTFIELAKNDTICTMCKNWVNKKNSRKNPLNMLDGPILFFGKNESTMTILMNSEEIKIHTHTPSSYQNYMPKAKQNRFISIRKVDV